MTERQRDGATGRRGDGAMERNSDADSLRLCLSITSSPCHPVAPSPRRPVPLSLRLLEYVGEFCQIGQIAVQLVPVMIGDLAAVFFGHAGSRRGNPQSQMHQFATVWQPAQDISDCDVARVIEARQTAGEKQDQNAFISFFNLRLTRYLLLLLHCYFPPKIKPPGARRRRTAKFIRSQK